MDFNDYKPRYQLRFNNKTVAHQMLDVKRKYIDKHNLEPTVMFIPVSRYTEVNSEFNLGNIIPNNLILFNMNIIFNYDTDSIKCYVNRTVCDEFQ
jgi:hypothetical protein